MSDVAKKLIADTALATSDPKVKDFLRKVLADMLVADLQKQVKQVKEEKESVEKR